MQSGYQEDIDFAAGETQITIVELMNHMPLIQGLDVSKYYMKVVFRLKIITLDVRLLCLLILNFVFG